MLITFVVGNFRSFLEPQTLSLVAANIVSQDRSLDENNVTMIGESTRVLKSAGVYGANASGKSNLVNALSFMRRFVLNSSKDSQATEPIEAQPFRLRLDSLRSPSLLEVAFLAEGVMYRYGFEINSERVVKEWLYHVPGKIEANLFVRENGTITLSRQFRKEGKALVERTRRNALFLSVAAQFNGPIAQTVVRWFQDLGIIPDVSSSLRDYSADQLNSPEHRQSILAFVRGLDLGISDVTAEERDLSLDPNWPEELRSAILKLPDGKDTVVNTTHPVYDSAGNSVGTVDFNLDQQESNGTRKLFALSGPILSVLRGGEVLVIDEIDTHLHALVTQAIVDLFNSTSTNPHGAQLIFTTHDVKLMNRRKLRRDQIWFASKNRSGATRLISLVEYKLRNDASYDKDYLGGRFGAIPFIDELARPLADVADEAV
jgi:AAA15 family ATPase/GTPase